MTLRIVLPGARYAAGQAYAPVADLVLPAFSRILGRAQRQQQAGLSAQACLRQLFSATDISAAALTLSLDMPDAPEGRWLRADPICVRADRDRAIIGDSALLQLDMREAKALVASLNAHFAEDGLTFYAPHPQRWYLRCDNAPDIVSTPLDQVMGDDMHPHLPRGSDPMCWHRWLNEMQMLLYTHPVNDAREMSGKPAVNAVWLWGEGATPRRLDAPAASLLAGDALACALARWADMTTLALPVSCPTSWSDNTLVWLDALLAPAQRGDLAGWRDALQALEQQWFAPLWRQWQAGAISHLQCILPDPAQTLVLDLTPGERWKFWRRGAPLTALAV